MEVSSQPHERAVQELPSAPMNPPAGHPAFQAAEVFMQGGAELLGLKEVGWWVHG